MHKCVICIGSNYNRKENLLLARRRLVDLFPTIRFTSEQETRPLFFRSPALFSNQVAMFFSDAEEERVRKELKAIEQSAGRRPEDKKEEKVSLDIDLLSYDDRILRPEDLKREYIVKGLEELKYNQISGNYTCPLCIYPFPCETVGYAGRKDGDTTCVRTSDRCIG